ncbi:hypothetical protein JG688_00013203 [Phytophthora aleatoria]|uniref:Uncharacterized protein n=1 Tax=Phytophthora aleatoria TaxID=2496075 RepID=A0A8J5J152_9STRA|nr:hypothetical protein JG688_00013203 [Phytophthora aleatoria]
MEWIVESKVPFSFCVRGRYNTAISKLDPLSDDTLTKYADAVTREALRKLSSFLTDKFGIMFDGSTFRSEHIFALFGRGGKSASGCGAVAGPR